MPSTIHTILITSMLAITTVHSQGVILSAQGDSGTSTGLQVDPSSSSNDANFISDAEISSNLVNECGRTLLAGNIDVGENTETALAAGQVTQVSQGSTVTVTIDAAANNNNASASSLGAGPYTCDMDQTGNTLGTTGQTALKVSESDADQDNGNITLTVKMPSDMACTGSSAGNVCTLRCRNALNYGGCVALQQTDTTPLPADNPPSNIATAASLADIEAQVQQDQKDLPAAIAGNQAAATVGDEQGVDVVQAILAADPAISAAVAEEVDEAQGGTKKKKTKTTKSTNDKRVAMVGRLRGARRFVNPGVAFVEDDGN